MSSPQMRTALPLALLTAVGMLATDLYLPAIPSLTQVFGATIEEAQWTMASFLGTLAASQLFWGWYSDRYGENLTIQIGTYLLIVAGIACAIAPSIYILIFARALQGLAAGAATVAVPALVRKRFNEIESVKAMSMISSIEALVPALGPVLGAAMIAVSSWRTSFWFLVILTIAILPFLTKVIGHNPPPEKDGKNGSYLPLFKDTAFLRFAFSYSIMFAALILMVASAPQIVVNWLALPVFYFSLMQVAGVVAFIALISQAGRLAETRGIPFLMKWGSVFQLIATVGFLTMGIFAVKSFYVMTALWCLFGAGLGLRGPSTFARALSLAGTMAGKGAGILMFLAFGICSVTTAAVAPYLDSGLTALGATMLGMTLISVGLVFRFAFLAK